jgi:hypothetical protein
MNHEAYAAGILPYTFYNGKVYLLLGKDVRDNFWSDFGGKSEIVDDNRPLQTAMREFYEETCGIIMDLKSLKNRMGSTTAPFQSVTQNGKKYFMYWVEIPYNSTYRAIYRRLLGYMRHIKMYKKRIEKTDIKWISAENVMRCETIQLRPVFRATFQHWWQREGPGLVQCARLLSDYADSTKSDNHDESGQEIHP